MDKHGNLFRTGAKVIGPYGSARVIQIEAPSDGPRYAWLYNKAKGNHRVWTMNIVKI